MTFSVSVNYSGRARTVEGQIVLGGLMRVCREGDTDHTE